MSTKLQQFLATSPWAQRLLLAIIAIIWAQHCSKWGPGVLDSTFKNLNPPFSDLDFLLTFAILQVTATAYFIYRGRHADLVMIHVTEQACSLIISSTNGRNARLKLSQLLSDLLLRISAAIGAMRFAANLNLLKTVAWIEFFKELSTLKLISLDSRISPDTSRLYLKYVNWDITFQVFYLLLCPVVAIKIRRSLEHTYVIMRLPRLLLVVAVVLWAICRESGLSHVRCFRLMFFELFFQSTGIFWVIWAPCDALARRSYVSRVQDINKDEGTASTQCSNREQLARRRCDQRNQLLTELRKSTSPIGLLFAINHKSEGIRFEEACKRRADANNIQFQSFDKLQPEEQCKIIEQILQGALRPNKAFTRVAFFLGLVSGGLFIGTVIVEFLLNTCVDCSTGQVGSRQIVSCATPKFRVRAVFWVSTIFIACLASKMTGIYASGPDKLFQPLTSVAFALASGAVGHLLTGWVVLDVVG